MPKPSKQIIIDAIIKEIEKGTGRGEVVARYCKKFQKSARTIDTYWKTANEQQKERQEKASKAADRAYITAKEKAAVEAVMSKQERMEYLTKIAKGEFENETKKPAWNNHKKVFEIVTVREKPQDHTVIKAIAELNKMEGDYAPAKIAQTDSAGNDISWNEIKIYEVNKKTNGGS